MSLLKAPEPSPRHGQPAGIVSRGAAVVIDLGIVWLVGAGIALSITLVRSMLNSNVNGLNLSGIGAFLAGASLLQLYLWACWGLGGRTLGQLLLGLRVQRVGGGDLKVLRSFARAWLATYVFGLFFLTAITRRSAAGYDVLLDTECVYDWTKATPEPR